MQKFENFSTAQILRETFEIITDYGDDAFDGLTEEIYLPGEYGPADTWNHSEIIWTNTNSTSKDFWDTMSIWTPATVMPGAGMATPRPGIQCLPTPGPFLPCNDLFDWWTLRCSVWIVFLLALLGKLFSDQFSVKLVNFQKDFELMTLKTSVKLRIIYGNFRYCGFGFWQGYLFHDFT